MGKTIEDLETLLAQLIECRHQEAYGIENADHDEGIEKLVRVHIAISAIKAVIAGSEGPEPDVPAMVG